METVSDQTCVICDHGISHPLCVNCLEHEIASFMTEAEPSLLNDVQGLLQAFRSYPHEVTWCIRCGQGMMVCNHCICKEIHQLLKTHDKSLAELFLFYFNFELLEEENMSAQERNL